jgi:hypothetical protein
MAKRTTDGLEWGRWTGFAGILVAVFLLTLPRLSLAKIGINLEWRPIEGIGPLCGKAGALKTFTVNGVTFKMVCIPAGEFMMGSPPSEPDRKENETQHRVRISRDFWLGQTEVTQGLWRAVMGSNPSELVDCGDDCPVEQVSWNDCQDFIRKLNGKVSGGNFRLPTEAEWEYACRAGTTTPFNTGRCLSSDQATTMLAMRTLDAGKARGKIGQSRWEVLLPTPGACMTCMGMYANGVRIGLGNTLRGRLRILRGPQEAPNGSAVAAVGPAEPGDLPVGHPL